MSTSDTYSPGRATSEEVERSIQRGGANWKPIAFQALLLILLSASLLILIVLLADIVVNAWPTFRDRGLSFITDGLSLNPETAGVWTAIVGSVIIAVIVAVLSFPIGIGAAIYLE